MASEASGRGGPDRPGEDGWRELALHALARLVRRYGAAQFDLCEDAVQEALIEAHRQWASTPPRDPAGWLVTTAQRRYVDLVRTERRRRDREVGQARLTHPVAQQRVSARDDSLLVLQLCCHPELSRSAQVALTLRAVSGLSTAQIANLYQVPETTLAQRITRAKRRLRDVGGRLPAPDGATDRLGPVLEVLYLMLTEAHHTTSGEPAQDTTLAAETLRLARLVHDLVPEDTEAAGLLALVLLTEARTPARLDDDGRLVPLDEQDRSRWDADLIADGLRVLDGAVVGTPPAPYLLQACIAALHCQAPSTEETDWREILALYRLLERVAHQANPNVELNRIVAESMVHGTGRGLTLLDDLGRRHPDLPRWQAVRAHLLERQGDLGAAGDAYRLAVAATRSTAERQHLSQRLRRLNRLG
ncbi:sigma-70 family RNA polymerase sigma factor [Nocardioides sp. W7]|uniref:RNA polymerase sigma factor n=1 Tax=Nocardioides sp. W7 TaxID=2931390 RepID=UPI001FD0A78F|nr:sigma-70 family RNA polymerase sigma factor [Nocardioides sp. W7]